MTLNRTSATFVLVAVTMLWGFAFIAQKNAMNHMGPLTYMGARYLLGGLLILPLAMREYSRLAKKLTRRQWTLIVLMSLNFFAGSWLQQEGLLLTTATNGGFLTGLYVMFVPIILLLVFRTRPHIIVWLCAPMALLGLYLLNGATLDHINKGDVLIIICAVFWGLHVVMLGYLSRDTGMPIVVSCVSFLLAGGISELGSFALETPTLEAITAGWVEIAYAGVFSTAIAFTLQAIAQVYVPPANAAIIMSGEALFAALGGAVLLGERLPALGYLGAAIIFAAIVLVETIPALKRSPSPEPPKG